jgi:hypothetical protein
MGMPESDSGTFDQSTKLLGIWKSGVRQTKYGPMTFEFRFGGEGELKVTGSPAKGSGGEVFRRKGPYRLKGEELVSPAINEGQPVQVRLQAGILIVRIDESLVLELRRV